MNDEKREYTLTYVGQWVSLNKVYGMNRYMASQLKKEWKHRFTEMLRDSDFKPLAAFKLSVRYNSRMDCDNVTGGTKLFCDTLRLLELVPNDDKRFYKGITVTPDSTLKHNTYIITVTEV